MNSFFRTYLFRSVCLSCLLGLWMSWGGTVVQAQQQQEVSAGREFDPQRLDSYREDRAFDYGQEPLPEGVEQRPEPKPIARPELGNFLIYLMYGLATVVVLGLIIFVISKTVGKSSSSLAMAGIPDLENQDIREVDLQQLLQAAIQAGEYRPAVRLLFLESLKRMTEQEWINWKPNKTNHDYQREMADRSQAEEFRQLTFAYEYIWYGNFSLEASQFEALRRRFGAFHQQISPKP
jgi:hypothetical protein